MEKNKTLLLLGIVAGLLWLIITYAQAFTREGFDLVRHSASLLEQGNLGWLQMTAFILAGAFYVASAIGLRRSITGTGVKWAPITLGTGKRLFAEGTIPAAFKLTKSSVSPRESFSPIMSVREKLRRGRFELKGICRQRKTCGSTGSPS